MNPNTGAIYRSPLEALKAGEDPDDIVEVDREQAMDVFRNRLAELEAELTDDDTTAEDELDALRRKWRDRERNG